MWSICFLGLLGVLLVALGDVARAVRVGPMLFLTSLSRRADPMGDARDETLEPGQ